MGQIKALNVCILIHYDIFIKKRNPYLQLEGLVSQGCELELFHYFVTHPGIVLVISGCR